jgi:hypothetical protein
LRTLRVGRREVPWEQAAKQSAARWD